MLKLTMMERLVLERLHIADVLHKRTGKNFVLEIEQARQEEYVSSYHRDLLNFVYEVVMPAEGQLGFFLYENQDALIGRTYDEKRRVADERSVTIPLKVLSVTENGIILEMGDENGRIGGLTQFVDISPEMLSSMLGDVLLRSRREQKFRNSYMANAFFSGFFTADYDNCAMQDVEYGQFWQDLRRFAEMPESKIKFCRHVLRLVGSVEKAGPLRSWEIARSLMQNDLAERLGCLELLTDICKFCAPSVPVVQAAELVGQASDFLQAREYKMAFFLLKDVQKKYARLDYPSSSLLPGMMKTAVDQLSDVAPDALSEQWPEADRWWLEAEEGAQSENAPVEEEKSVFSLPMTENSLPLYDARQGFVSPEEAEQAFVSVYDFVMQAIDDGNLERAELAVRDALSWHCPEWMNYYSRLQMLLAGVLLRQGKPYACSESLRSLQATNWVTIEEMQPLLNCQQKHFNHRPVGKLLDWQEWLRTCKSEE